MGESELEGSAEEVETGLLCDVEGGGGGVHVVVVAEDRRADAGGARGSMIQ